MSIDQWLSEQPEDKQASLYEKFQMVMTEIEETPVRKQYNDPKLQVAMDHPLWVSHQIGDKYHMDGKGSWDMVYYPIMGDGKINEDYDEPRVLMVTKKMYGKVEGLDLREVPLRYISRIEKKGKK